MHLVTTLYHCVTSEGKIGPVMVYSCPCCVLCTPYQCLYGSVCVILWVGCFQTASSFVVSMTSDIPKLSEIAKQKTHCTEESRMVSNWSCCCWFFLIPFQFEMGRMSFHIELWTIWYPNFIDIMTKRGKLSYPSEAQNLVSFLLIDQNLIHL